MDTIDYFFDMDAPEDKDENEEQFVPRPYYPKTTTSKQKKKAETKKPETKEPKKEAPKPHPTANEGQLDLFSMLGGDVAA